MTITGYQFDRMRVTPANDALLNAHLSQGNKVVKGYRNNLNVQASGLNVYVDTGAALINGRLVEVTEQHTILVGANTTGYIVLTVDLSQQNTSEGTPGNEDYTPINNQVRCESVSSLVQQDILNDGKIYTFPLATYSSSGTSVTVTKINASYTSGELKKVYSGASFFKDGNVVEWAEADMKEGIWITFSGYVDGGPAEAFFETRFIPRHDIINHHATNHRFLMNDGTARKVFYPRKDGIKGADINADAPHNTFCIREIYIK